MAEYQAKNGITTMCPTSMTLNEEMLTDIFRAAASYQSREGADFAGIHMEGPFISAAKNVLKTRNLSIGRI
jgi:N-acetylglucosamine-6-phosphate deacetylase